MHSASHDQLAPSPWIVRFAALVPAGARVLDLAAGRGRHARYFAARGANVLAVDRDADALAACGNVAGITTCVADLEAGAWPLADERFDAIVVVNYLHRPLFAELRAALAPDGVLLYTTFAMGNERYGKPTRPEFLLCQGELLSLAAAGNDPLVVLAFEQGRREDSTRTTVVQSLAAVGSGRAWPSAMA